jgi:hypothetical protein
VTFTQVANMSSVERLNLAAQHIERARASWAHNSPTLAATLAAGHSTMAQAILAYDLATRAMAQDPPARCGRCGRYEFEHKTFAHHFEPPKEDHG